MVRVISKADTIKYILPRPVLSGRLAKWAMILEQYDDLPGQEVFVIDILSPWEMYFAGAARQDGAGEREFLSPLRNTSSHTYLC